MPGYYDDNFGWYDIRDEEDIKFYHQMQKQSIWKKCSICGQRVKIKPEYDKCNRCCEILEQGGDPY